MRLFPQCVLATLLYSDIFHSPLTFKEIDKRLLFVKERGEYRKIQLKNILNSFPTVSQKDGYYFFKKEKKYIREIKKKKKYSLQKRKRAEKYVQFLKWIPMIEYVGLTGAVAVGGSEKDDDIDLLIITKPGLVWTTRFFTTLYFDILQIRRHPKDILYQDKFCLNMFLDRCHLRIPINEQDIYSAYEIIQMKILWERNDVYKTFLNSNTWIEKILPHAWNILQKKYPKRSIKRVKTNWLVAPIEYVFRTIQIGYMNRRNKMGGIENGAIRFYPKGRRQKILSRFEEKCHQFQLDILMTNRMSSLESS